MPGDEVAVEGGQRLWGTALGHVTLPEELQMWVTETGSSLVHSAEGLSALGEGWHLCHWLVK